MCALYYYNINAALFGPHDWTRRRRRFPRLATAAVHTHVNAHDEVFFDDEGRRQRRSKDSLARRGKRLIRATEREKLISERSDVKGIRGFVYWTLGLYLLL